MLICEISGPFFGKYTHMGLNALLILGIDYETCRFIYRATGAYRYGTACAAGVLLMASCAVALLLSETTRINKKTFQHKQGKV